jgi:hypothetical protein
MLDFFDERTHWQRRLWNVGLVLSLREVLEADEELGRSLSPAAVRALAELVATRVRADPGAGSDGQQQAIAGSLQQELDAGGFAHRGIELALRDIEPRYLDRWQAALNAEGAPGREATARALASHLLDAGLTPAHLYRWLRALKDANEELPVLDLIDEAKQLLAEAPTTHELFVAFEVEPRLRGSRPQEWIDSSTAAKWLRDCSHEPLQQRGGFRLRFDAKSPEEAVGRAADVIDRFAARVAVGVRSHLRFSPTAYLATGEKLALTRGRHVEVRALERERVVGDLGGGGVVDAARELLSHLQQAPAPVAVAGGWSAIESLLRGPGDEEQPNVIAADRLAALVACSWPRAELTDLAWARIRAQDDALSATLAAAPSNREKAIRFAHELAATETNPGLKRGTDIAAQHRVRQLLANPSAHLAAISGHASESLRRLYRQRNLVMHGGRTSAVALGAALRTAAPLVGAGFDRLVHGSLVKGFEPLELAARADFELARVEAGDVEMLVDMLE